MLQVTCPHCGLRFLVPATVQGKRGVCFGCGGPVTVPAAPNGAEASLDFRRGDRVSDRYEIEEKIGRGGMGMVYRALDSLMHEKVALKFMHPGLLRTERGQQLFLREAQVARRLRHDHVVAVHDVGRSDEGIMYLSMEFLSGQSLRSFLRRRRTERKLVDVRLAVSLMGQILDALGYAHRYVVHRDMKPENVMLLPGENVKVLDFGLAKAVEEDAQGALEEEENTDRSRVIGTEAYAAPEQRMHRDIDLRADVYTAGLLLHELLTLRTPIDPPVTVPDVRDDVAPSIIAVLEKALRPERDNRWQSAGEFRAELLKAFKESYQPKAAPQIIVPSRGSLSSVEMIYQEGGSFLMGNAANPDEAPQQEVQVDPFHIDVSPVTNEQYAEFLKATGYPEPKFWRNNDLNGAKQPVVGVSWADAQAFATWAGKQLPTEAQWEFAARGKQNRKYPWGNEEPNSTRCNYGDFLSMPSIVTMHEEGATPEGILDLAGNVYEWTADLFGPYDPARRQAALRGSPPRRSVRGGSWHSPPQELRCASRKGLFPESQLATVGFRCVAAEKGGE